MKAVLLWHALCFVEAARLNRLKRGGTHLVEYERAQEQSLSHHPDGIVAERLDDSFGERFRGIWDKKGGKIQGSIDPDQGKIFWAATKQHSNGISTLFTTSASGREIHVTIGGKSYSGHLVYDSADVKIEWDNGSVWLRRNPEVHKALDCGDQCDYSGVYDELGAEVATIQVGPEEVRFPDGHRFPFKIINLRRPKIQMTSDQNKRLMGKLGHTQPCMGKSNAVIEWDSGSIWINRKVENVGGRTAPDRHPPATLINASSSIACNKHRLTATWVGVTNWVLKYGNNAIMVDYYYPHSYTKHVLKALAVSNVKALFISHDHFDHTGDCTGQEKLCSVARKMKHFQGTWNPDQIDNVGDFGVERIYAPRTVCERLRRAKDICVSLGAGASGRDVPAYEVHDIPGVDAKIIIFPIKHSKPVSRLSLGDFAEPLAFGFHFVFGVSGPCRASFLHHGTAATELKNKYRDAIAVDLHELGPPDLLAYPGFKKNHFGEYFDELLPKYWTTHHHPEDRKSEFFPEIGCRFPLRQHFTPLACTHNFFFNENFFNSWAIGNSEVQKLGDARRVQDDFTSLIRAEGIQPDCSHYNNA